MYGNVLSLPKTILYIDLWQKDPAHLTTSGIPNGPLVTGMIGEVLHDTW